MNTNALKKFAQEARKKLITQIGAKMELVLSSDSAELREKATQVRKLQEAINASSKKDVIDRVAYTWFNRLMALRFMDANDYQPVGMRVVTPKDGYTLPEILDEAKQGHISDELPVKKQHIYDVLDGRIPSSNAQNEAYKELLIGACNHLNKVFPFLFEKLSDYTELLLPDDLISEFSIIHDIREGMSTEDCNDVEIIGWLYQFYISEKKDEVFTSNNKVEKEDIPAATQLFTPRWIVEYMVQNTVGKLWLQNKPNSKLREHMPYFIESPSLKSDDYLKLNSIEELTLLDQACGSGHILVYGFDLLYKIYEEEGYNPNEIPELIIKNNLFGFEIDERASQLAGIALMMKARSYNRRFFRKEVEPNILCYKDLVLTNEEIKDSFQQIGHKLSDDLLSDLTNMQQATNYGSLIAPRTPTQELEKVLAIIITKENTNDAFLKYQLELLKTSLQQLNLLSQKYHCIVDNPPYMGGGNMNKLLGDFVKLNYPDSKADLMACFMEAGLNMLPRKGFLGMINQHSWMFLSSYEKLREKLIKETFFDTLLHLGPRTFPEIGGEVVQNASFTFWNTIKDANGAYIRLVEEGSSDLKRTKTLEAIQNVDCSWFYTSNQKNFEKIPGSPIGFWISKKSLKCFSKNQLLGEIAPPSAGLQTGENSRFLRYYFEVNTNDINENSSFVRYNKAGGNRKWYGLDEFIIKWKNNGFELKQTGKAVFRNSDKYFKESISWGLISTGQLNTRYYNDNFIFDNGAPSLIINNNLFYYLGLLNSRVSGYFLSVINPTLNFQVGNISGIPVCFAETQKIENLVHELIAISKTDWNSREISWDFQQNELVRIKGQDLEEIYDLYQQYWKNKFFQLHKNEEELNKQFIDIYGLQDELTPDVPLEDITILKEETKIVNGQLDFQADEVFQQLMSYAVGCMFGRYSLDKEGLILEKTVKLTTTFQFKLTSSFGVN